MAARGRQARGDRAGERVEAEDVDGRRVGVRRGDPAQQGGRRTRRRPEPVGDAARERPGALGLDVDERRRHEPPGPVRETRHELGDALVSDIRDEDRRRAGPLRPVDARHAPDPGLERSEHRRAVGEHVGVVPLRGGEHRDRGPVRVEVAGVLVGLHDERRPVAPAGGGGDADPGRGRSAAARPTKAPGSAPPAASTPTSQPDVVLLPCVPATATSVRCAAASATTCCHASSGIPAVRAATSSGLSGSIAVSALVTASRAGGGSAARTCAGSWRSATWIPAAASAGVYWLAPPGSQPSTAAPAQAASSAAAEAPAPAAPTTWIRSPGSIGRAARAGASPAPTAAAPRTGVMWPGLRVMRRRRSDPPRRGRAAARSPPRRCRRLFVLRSPVHRYRRTSGDPTPAIATYTRPTGFSSVPPSGPATPVTPTPRSACSRSRAPSAIATATCADTAPCASSAASGTPSCSALTSFAYATIPPRT